MAKTRGEKRVLEHFCHRRDKKWQHKLVICKIRSDLVCLDLYFELGDRKQMTAQEK